MPFQLGQAMLFLLHLRLQVGNLLFDGGEVALGGRQFLQREVIVVVFGDHHEIAVAVHLRDLAQGILLLPGWLNGLGLIEVKLQSVLLEAVEALGIELSPRLAVFHILVELRQLGCDGILVAHGLHHLHSEVGRLFAWVVGLLNLFQLSKGFTIDFRASRQLLRLVVDRLQRAGDVDHAHRLQLLEESIGVATQQDEIIFRHFSYHLLPPLLLCVCFSRFSAKPWRGSPHLPYIA